MNLGIQADNVQAEVMAVGHQAKAIQYLELGSPDRTRLADLLADLRGALRQHIKDPGQQALLDNDLAELEKAAKQQRIERPLAERILAGLMGKLKTVGMVVTEVANVVRPIKGLCSLLGLSFKSLGL